MRKAASVLSIFAHSESGEFTMSDGKMNAMLVGWALLWVFAWVASLSMDDGDPFIVSILSLVNIVGALGLLVSGINTNQERKERAVSMRSSTDSWFSQNGYQPNMAARFGLVTNNGNIEVIPSTDGKVLVILDAYSGKKYTIYKGSITSFHTDVDGVTQKITGGYAFGFGMAKGTTEIDKVSEVLVTNNIYNPVMKIRIAGMVEQGEFYKIQDFITRFEAVLSMYL